MAEAPPAPRAILRGHKAQVHAAVFFRNNERLLTGDASGFVVVWDLTIMRPRAVWRAHEGAILGIKGWGRDKIITHGRDNKLIAWKLGLEDEERLSTALPLEDVMVPRPQPWVLHLLSVNTMNFCSFAACNIDSREVSTDLYGASGILIAVPHTLASEAIDVYSLPNQDREHTIKTNQKNGMAMSLSVFHQQGTLTLLAAFENGFASVHRLQVDGQWTTTYRSQAHTQPILSLDVHPSLDYFITSAADAIVAKHPIPTAPQAVSSSFTRDDRVVELDDPNERHSSALAASLKESTPHPGTHSPDATYKPWEHPLRALNTKHSGQQGLSLRSDGRIFATAGWDTNVRIYSSKTMKELAVLQWHKVGCYAVAFSDVASRGASHLVATVQGPLPDEAKQDLASSNTQLIKQSLSVKDRRLRQATDTHWIAAGDKAGKVSLWDIY